MSDQVGGNGRWRVTHIFRTIADIGLNLTFRGRNGPYARPQNEDVVQDIQGNRVLPAGVQDIDVNDPEVAAASIPPGQAHGRSPQQEPDRRLRQHSAAANCWEEDLLEVFGPTAEVDLSAVWGLRVNYCWISRIPRYLRPQACIANFQCEDFGDISFHHKEWATNWLRYYEFKKLEIIRGDFQIALSRFEASELLRLTERTSNSSLYARVRRSMEGMDRRSGLHVGLPSHCNPMYIFVNLWGPGWVVEEALHHLSREIERACGYNAMTSMERLRWTPPRPPVHTGTINPMILMVHFDRSVGDVAFNPSYCLECFEMGHFHDESHLPHITLE